MDNLVEKLEIYRLENRLSQEELAKHLSVAFSTVNRWFNGRSQPSKIQEYHIRKLLDGGARSLASSATRQKSR